MARFTPRQRKHKANGRPDTSITDTNQTVILPDEQRIAREQRRGDRQDATDRYKPSAQKQKRLDKYIETKLRQDESRRILSKLSAHKEDTRGLQSSRNLGKRSYAAFVADGAATASADQSSDTDEDDDESEIGSSGDDVVYRGPPDVRITDTTNGHPSISKPNLISGSGLKRPLQLDENGLPIIQPRARQSKAVPEDLEEPWEGFDSDSDRISSASEASDMEIERPPSGFAVWAKAQIDKSLGYQPSNVLDELPQQKPTTHTTNGTIPAATETTHDASEHSQRKIFSVQIQRPTIIQESRLKLPVVVEEQKIMEAVHNNDVVILWGSTGSGKTTQVPQFLFEAGYGDPKSDTPGMIGVTQPRRVAAVSMAQRVRDEMGQQGQRTSYQIRFDSTTTSQTAIKFMTDGIMMREMAQDILLRKYSVIIIDEAHERSTNTDILIGMLSKIVPRRTLLSTTDPEIRPLKLIIMSATLNVLDFTRSGLFKTAKPPPVVQVEGRQYPVVTHFSRITQRDYVEEMVRKVVKGHKKLPPGAILVFLTGQNEIQTVYERLLKSLASQNDTRNDAARVRVAATDMPLEADDWDMGVRDDYQEDSDVDIIADNDDDDDEEFNVAEEVEGASWKKRKEPLRPCILQLYSQMPTKDQIKVFQAPPEGTRLIVLATNVAETSLTIPGIRYVFDCGRSKERVYQPTTGIQSYEIGWISKASAEQRAGRAGRTGSGHCYRLYSSAVYERDFIDHAEPEILKVPAEGVVLQVRSLHFPLSIAKFPFPTVPSQVALAKAEKLLRNLGALSGDSKLTPLGRQLSLYPLPPRLAKMLVRGLQHGNLVQLIALVAALAVGNIFIPDNQVDMKVKGYRDGETYTTQDHANDDARERRKQQYGRARALFSRSDKFSDAVKTLTAIVLHSQASDKSMFCNDHFLRFKAMAEVEQLRRQLTDQVATNHPEAYEAAKATLKLSSKQDWEVMKTTIASAFIDQIAIRADLAPNPPDTKRNPQQSIIVPYLPLIPLQQSSRGASTLEEKAVYIHPSSVLARLNPKELPAFVVYSHLQQSQHAVIGSGNTPKTRMFPLTPIGGAQLAMLAHGTPLLRYGKPISHVNVLPGRPLRHECWVVPEFGPGDGTMGWALPARKIVQVQDPKRGWVVEKFLT